MAKESNYCGHFLGLMFLDRDIAHREHLRTTSFAQHKALQSFYEDIVELADDFAEVYQGGEGSRIDIPLVDNEAKGSIDSVLREHLKWIEENRGSVCDAKDTPLQNIIDEVVAHYRRTLYMLTLK